MENESTRGRGSMEGSGQRHIYTRVSRKQRNNVIAIRALGCKLKDLDISLDCKEAHRQRDT